MHPNDVQLLSVFARETGQPIQGRMVSSEAGFEIVVQARSGTALFGTGARYRVFVTLRNLTSHKVIAHTACLGPGHLGDSHWPTPAFCYAFAVPPRSSDDHPHVCEILALLEVGIIQPYISFSISPKLILL